MTVQVYRHKVRAITDAMIIRGLELAVDKGDKEIERIYKYKATNAFLDNYSKWWDSNIIDYMQLKSNVKPAKEIFNRLFYRRLFKLIHRRGINDHEIADVNLRNKFLTLDGKERRNLEREIASILRTAPENIILNIISIKNPTYRSPAEKISEDEIQVLLKDNMPRYLKEIHWSILSLPNVEEKQQYIEVYAPRENRPNLSRNLLKSIEKSLYRR